MYIRCENKHLYPQNFLRADKQPNFKLLLSLRSNLKDEFCHFVFALYNNIKSVILNLGMETMVTKYLKMLRIK